MKNGSEGAKAIRAASDATVLSAVESRQDTEEHSLATKGLRAEAAGRMDGRTFANTLRGRLTKDRPRAVAARPVRNINVNGGNMRPIRSQFHSRSNTPPPGCHRPTRIARRPPRLIPSLRSCKSASPYRGESAFGNPKLCAAATCGHLIQCLSNWVMQRE